MNGVIQRPAAIQKAARALFAATFMATAVCTAAALRAAEPATIPAPTTSSVHSSLAYSTEARTAVTDLPPAPNNATTLADLKAIQARVEAVAKMAIPAVVSIQFPFAQGSGVIVSRDGYILTAGHVSGTPGQVMQIVLADGRRVFGKSLGANNGIDSGMIKIIDAGTYPFVPVGSARKLVAGQWVVALGHPGGYVRDRPPVVRLGRVLLDNYRMIGTDCPLISGDSGGPVFDLNGRLVGINSRIGPTTTANFHVPIDTFLDTWTQLAKGEQWGGASDLFGLGREGAGNHGLTLGIHAMFDDKGARISEVRTNTPASRAGLLKDDIITLFNGKPVKDLEDLADDVSHVHPGELITLGVLRAGKQIDVSIKFGNKRRRAR